MISLPSHVFKVAIALTILSTSAVPGLAEEQAEQLLSGMERFFATNRKVELSVRTNIRVSGPYAGLGDNFLHTHKEMKVWRDGSNWRLSGETTHFPPPKSTERVDKALKDDSCITFVTDERGGDPGGLGYLSKVPEIERLSFAEPEEFFPIHGVFPNNNFLPLPAILRQGSLSVRKERQRDRDYWVLQSKGQWGFHEVWFAQSQPSIPVYIVQRKQGEDKHFENKPVNSMPAVRLKDGSTVRIERLEVVYNATQIANVGNDPMVLGFTMTDRTVFSNGTAHVRQIEVAYSNFRRDPVWDKDVFKVIAPDGTPFFEQNEMQIRYEWRDGEIVKSLSEDAIKNLEGLRARRSRWIGRGLLALGLVAIVGLLAVFWYRRRLQGGQT
jgi:hypothetical protein